MAFESTATVRRWAKNVEAEFARINRAAIAEVARRTVARTPVLTGRARAGYHVTVSTPGYRFSNDTDPSGETTVARVRAALAATALGQTVYLTNQVPYIVRLEYGHSAQSPQGMVRVTAQEWPQIVNAAARQARR